MDPALLDARLAELAPIHREVLLLRYRNELSYAEIALVTGASIGTVRSRLHYARRQLQALLTDHSHPRRPPGAPSSRGVE